MATTKIEVTFPKKVEPPYWSRDTRERYELETFIFEADASKSMHDQSCDAFEEACRRGHNPNKQIRMHWIDGSPVKAPDGEDVDVVIDCPNGRKNGSLRAKK